MSFKTTYWAVLPKSWAGDNDRFMRAVNRACKRETGSELFYASPEEAVQANREAGATDERMDLPPMMVTLESGQ